MNFLNQNTVKTQMSLGLKQTLDACEAIYQQCLIDGHSFNSYEYLRLDAITKKRVELGYTAGSNSTIVKGKQLWLTQNQHRLNKVSGENTADPMLSVVQKIRADLEHEAKQKIEAAEIAWNEEKEGLVLEAESLTSELGSLKTTHQRSSVNSHI